MKSTTVEPPGGTVTVGLSQDEAAHTVVLRVSDEGPGMPPELVAAIISGQVDDVPVERSIGIWVVSNLVARIGADLSIRSKEGAGTTVQLTLTSEAEKGSKAR